MTALLGKYSKQSNETLDWDVDFTDWFGNRTDTPASAAVVAEVGLTAIGNLVGNIVKVVVSGGTNGTTYKITVRLTTGNSLIKEADFKVTIKDI